MPPLADALAHWHEFYALLGTAAGTLVGLLFVAATVAAGVFPTDRRAPLRDLPVRDRRAFQQRADRVADSSGANRELDLARRGGPGCGLIGVAYYGLVCRDATRDGLMAAIDLEDRIWYAVLPVVTYLSEAVSGIMLASRWAAGCAVLAISLTALLVVGIHNAWDITVWTITRRRE